MIEEFINGFIYIPINLYKIAPHCFYILGRIIGIILFIFIIVVLIDFILRILGLDKTYEELNKSR